MRIFSCYFGVPFPITSINGLDKGLEIGEVVRFAYTGNLILDSGRNSVVDLSSECSVTPLDSSCKVVESNKVFGDTLVVTHLEILNFFFGLPFRVMGSKVGSELRDEFIVVVKPVGCHVGE